MPTIRVVTRPRPIACCAASSRPSAISSPEDDTVIAAAASSRQPASIAQRLAMTRKPAAGWEAAWRRCAEPRTAPQSGASPDRRTSGTSAIAAAGEASTMNNPRLKSRMGTSSRGPTGGPRP